MNSNKFQNLTLTSPQLALVASFQANNLSEFNRAIRNGANVNLRDHASEYSVFEMACKTPGKKEFIKACLDNGVNVLECNPETKEYPIHLAAFSLDCENLSTLLEKKPLIVDQKYEDRTALFSLFEEIGRDNTKWEQYFQCMKVLLKKDADINATNEDNRHMLEYLVYKNSEWRKTILNYCLNNYSVNADFNDGRVRELINKHFPETVIPAYNMEKITLDDLSLMICTKSDDSGFIKRYKKYCSQNGVASLADDVCKDLLSKAVCAGKLASAKILIEHKLQNDRFVGDMDVLSGLLEKCCNRGDVAILKWLLDIIPMEEVDFVNKDSPLSLLAKQIDLNKDKNKCPFFESIKKLLDDDRVEVDKVDITHCTALHYAVRYKIDHVQELLLAKGAYVGAKNKLGELPISDMDSLLLEKHLDTCVDDNHKKPGDENYEVKINFKNFVPLVHKQKHTKRQSAAFNRGSYEDEMRPIVHMAQSSSLKRLLRHPVISSILLLKWLKLVCFFYINLLICTIFFVSFTMYVVFCYGRDDAPFKLLFYGLSLIGWFYLILRELIQFLLNMRVYLKSLENGMEVLLIITSGAVLSRDFDDEFRRVASSCVILLAALEFLLLVGTLPVLSISTHMVMLKTVSKNFLKCLILYSIILLAFAFSFYTLFRVNGSTQSESSQAEKDASTTSQGDADDDQFNQFGEVPLALMKTAVMLTGEFEAANIKFQHSNLTYVVFALFLFFVSIVLFNLMNGLAVSDTAAIKSEAEIIGIVQKAFLIDKYENALKTSKPIRCITERLSWIYASNSLQLFPHIVPHRVIAVKPNQSNVIMVSSSVQGSTHDVEKGDWELDETLLQSNKFGTDCCLIPCMHNMDGKIVKYALEILHSRQENDSSIEYRLSRVEQSIEKMSHEQMELKELLQTFIKTLQKDG
ncbi:transient receptor potential cation channel protein painless [Anopheles nili]|uniref:transient receptor potential cation channel protein painless n=1 Tax=Anopheles nili TaxID=185578 RepID=UPI00237B6081|nr:transient receptor potential cation channel protein painless [Anopheles nili]